MTSTIGAKGVIFRSVLHAQWSFVFTELNWNWEYEPYDMNEYIPDFIVSFKNGNELLIKVKKTLNVWNKQKECDDDIKQIQNSGWKHKFIIVVGSVGFSDSDGVSFGIVGGFDDECGFYDLPGSVLELNNSDGSWAIINESGDSDDYDMGLYNGKNLDHYTLRHTDTHTMFEEIWTESKNSVFRSSYHNRILF